MEAPKKRFKTAMAASARSDAPGAAGAIAPSSLATSSLPSDIALAQAIERDGERLATLRAKRETAAKEVMAAEENLLEVKTAVEDAEAIYNNVRADLAASAHAEAHHGDADDEAHAEDWDKYLHFGEGGDGGGGPDEETAAAAAAAAAAAVKTEEEHKEHIKVTASERGEGKPTEKTSDGSDEGPDEEGPSEGPSDDPSAAPPPLDAVQSPEAAAAMKGAVAAAVRVASSHGDAVASAVAANPDHQAHAHHHGAAAEGLRGGENNPHHHAFRPSLAEAEQFLLSELKKLEHANARLMTARAKLGEIERELEDAAAAHAANEVLRERREAELARLRENGEGGGAVSGGGGDDGASRGDDDDDDSFGEADAEDEDEDEDGPKKGAASGGSKPKGGGSNSAGLEGGSGSGRGSGPGSGGHGGGGKVIEDRRFGIYDSRRYRMEGEPAPPDPSDDEMNEHRSVRGRGASANNNKGGGARGDADKNKAEKSKKSEAEKGGKGGESGKVGKKQKTGVSADAEIRPGGGRGRGGRGRGYNGGRYSSEGGRGGGRVGATGRRVEPGPGRGVLAEGGRTKSGGFLFKGGVSKDAKDGKGSFVAPSANEAATFVARGGGPLRWRMKRPRTRQTVGRPAVGPTSWGASCAFALWRAADLKAFKERAARRAAGEEPETESEEDERSDYGSSSGEEEEEEEGRSEGGGEEEGGAEGEDPETPGGFTIASSQGGESVSNPWDDDELVFQDFDVVGEDGAIDLGMMIDMGEFEP